MPTDLVDEDTPAAPMGPDFLDSDDAQMPPDLDPDPDPEAPYGRNPKTGKPYRYSREERERRAQVMNAARWGNRPPTPKAPGRTSSSSGRGKARVDYRAGVTGLMQIPAFLAGIVARFTGNAAFALDSATLTLHAPGVADALDAAAQQHAWIAQALDKALEAGPYGAGLAALVPLALQLAANHGKIPTNNDVGILDGDALMAALAAQAKRS